MWNGSTKFLKFNKQHLSIFRFAQQQAWQLWCCFAFVALLSLPFLLPLSSQAAQAPSLSIDIEGISYRAELAENVSLLKRIRTSGYEPRAQHFRGTLSGHPGTSVRVTRTPERWRGIVIKDDAIFRIDQSTLSALTSGVVSGVSATPLQASNRPQLCGMDGLVGRPRTQAAVSTSTSFNTVALPVAAIGAPPCANAINGVCLLPHIELAYDLSYQAMPNFGMTALDRAISEINEMEVFFERGLGYRFSQLSLTMLTAQQEINISDTLNPYLLIDNLYDLRRSGGLDEILVSGNSIFHFVTGRDLLPVDPLTHEIDEVDGDNIVGIAYPNQVCNGTGANTGFTDAGDVGDVSDPGQSLVSLIMAHEIGHNLGAKHDNDENSCAANQFVMDGSIDDSSLSITDFSVCSVSEIQQAIADVPDYLDICFDYPLDSTIVETTSPSAPPKADPFDAIYAVSYDRIPAADISTQLIIAGAVTQPDEGCFVEVLANGPGNCIVAADGRSYQCNVLNPPPNFDVVVSAVVQADASEFNAEHEVLSGTSSLVEVNASNNTANQFYNVFSTTGSSDCPDYVAQPVNNSGSNSSSNGASGGGGGSIGIIGLAALLMRRRYYFRVQSNG